jgi:hypothetical protein
VPVKLKESLAFGTFFHDMLRAVYDYVRTNELSPDVEDLIDEVQHYAEPWIDSFIDQASRETTDETTLNMLERHGAICSVMLPRYIEFWEKDFKEFEWVSLETEFDTEFENFRLRGKRDGLFQRKAKKGKKKSGVWLLETKTKGTIAKDLADTLAIDGQNLFYVLATKLSTGHVPAGVLYNVVRRPGQKLKPGEGPSEYADRVAEDMDKRPEHYFVRVEVAYPKSIINRFTEDLARKLEAFRVWAEDMDANTYRSECACRQMWTCDYLQACATGSMRGYVQSRLFSELSAPEE